MDIVTRITGIVNEPIVLSALVIFTVIMVSYSIYTMARNYMLLAAAKKKKKEMEAELAKINLKLEEIKKDLASKRGK